MVNVTRAIKYDGGGYDDLAIIYYGYDIIQAAVMALILGCASVDGNAV